MGSILFPAEGEGRNALYAAQLGWTVSAFDLSDVGKQKAKKLFYKYNVKVDYIISEYDNLPFLENQFDIVALIYAHVPAEIKSDFNKKSVELLKTDGIVIFEAFSKNHGDYIRANPNVGGPTTESWLFSKEDILNDFSNFEIVYLNEEVITLNEGPKHNGVGSVIRFIGKKK